MAFRTPPLITPFAILSAVLALGATNVAVNTATHTSEGQVVSRTQDDDSQKNFFGIKNKKKNNTKKIANTKDYKEVKADMSEKEYAERLRKEKLRQQREGA